MPKSTNKPKLKHPLLQMNKRNKESPYVCMACKDTKKNSHGGDCYPCVATGRIAPPPVANPHTLRKKLQRSKLFE